MTVTRIKAYVHKHEYTTKIQPLLDENTPFSSFLQDNNIHVVELLPQRIRDVVLRVYGEIPCMEIVYSDDTFERKVGEDVFLWLESQRTLDATSFISPLQQEEPMDEIID
jgi:hypothetical protein